ncbi:MAG: hypothetical protein JW772_04035 [Candidatus Diapherotrites archaeon]|nr:hypothetical protein [Candidatus Diapherotrites archaeon]
MKRIIFALLVLLIVLFSGCPQPPMPPVDTLPNDFALDYSSGAMHLEWGRYSLTIDSDGSSVFTKGMGLRMETQDTFTASEEEMLGIYNAALTSGFFSLAEYYEDPFIMDGGWSKIRITGNGESKLVSVANASVTAFEQVESKITGVIKAHLGDNAYDFWQDCPAKKIECENNWENVCDEWQDYCEWGDGSSETTLTIESGECLGMGGENKIVSAEFEGNSMKIVLELEEICEGCELTGDYAIEGDSIAIILEEECGPYATECLCTVQETLTLSPITPRTYYLEVNFNGRSIGEMNVSPNQKFTPKYCDARENRRECIEYCESIRCPAELCDTLMFDAPTCFQCAPGCCSYCNDLDSCADTLGCKIVWLHPAGESWQYSACENANYCFAGTDCSYLSLSYQGYRYHSLIEEDTEKAAEYAQKADDLQDLFNTQCNTQ